MTQTDHEYGLFISLLEDLRYRFLQLANEQELHAVFVRAPKDEFGKKCCEKFQDGHHLYNAFGLQRCKTPVTVTASVPKAHMRYYLLNFSKLDTSRFLRLCISAASIFRRAPAFSPTPPDELMVRSAQMFLDDIGAKDALNARLHLVRWWLTHLHTFIMKRGVQHLGLNYWYYDIDPANPTVFVARSISGQKINPYHVLQVPDILSLSATRLAAFVLHLKWQQELGEPLLKNAETGEMKTVLPYIFKKTGHVWTIAFRGERGHVKDLAGMGYIQHLIRNRHQTFTTTEFLKDMAAPEIHADAKMEAAAILDDEARVNYTKRVKELDILIRAIDTALDTDISSEKEKAYSVQREAMQKEKTMLVKMLRQAKYMKSGKKLNASFEKNRKRIAGTIKTAIKAIAAANMPNMAEHLRQSIKASSGMELGYAPKESGIAWTVD